MRYDPRMRETGSPLGSTCARWDSSRVVKSIQRGTVTIAAASATGTATFTAVDLNNSTIEHLGTNYDTANNTTANPFIGLSAAGTTMTGTRANGTAGTVIVGWQLTEYFPGVIRSVQRGTKAINGGSTSYTAILATTVQDITRCQLTSIGRTGDTNTYAGQFWQYMTLTNTTTITWTSTWSGGGLVATEYYQVVEWY